MRPLRYKYEQFIIIGRSCLTYSTSLSSLPTDLDRAAGVSGGNEGCVLGSGTASYVRFSSSVIRVLSGDSPDRTVEFLATCGIHSLICLSIDFHRVNVAMGGSLENEKRRNGDSCYGKPHLNGSDGGADTE